MKKSDFDVESFKEKIGSEFFDFYDTVGSYTTSVIVSKCESIAGCVKRNSAAMENLNGIIHECQEIVRVSKTGYILKHIMNGDSILSFAFDLKSFMDGVVGDCRSLLGKRMEISLDTGNISGVKSNLDLLEMMIVSVVRRAFLSESKKVDITCSQSDDVFDIKMVSDRDFVDYKSGSLFIEYGSNLYDKYFMEMNFIFADALGGDVSISGGTVDMHIPCLECSNVFSSKNIKRQTGMYSVSNVMLCDIADKKYI